MNFHIQGYGPLAQSSTSEEQISFIHHPIQDLGVPSSIDSLLSLLSKLLQHLEIMKNNDHHQQPKIIYSHCWGGIGRAALVGSCLASLLYPELTANEILDWVQRGYDTRVTAKSSNGTLTCICKRICWWGTNNC